MLVLGARESRLYARRPRRLPPSQCLRRTNCKAEQRSETSLGGIWRERPRYVKRLVKYELQFAEGVRGTARTQL